MLLLICKSFNAIHDNKDLQFGPKSGLVSSTLAQSLVMTTGAEN
jgi:hypothetical protein